VELSFYAIFFTRLSQGIGTGTAPTFVMAGGAGSYPECIVRYRDLSPDGLRKRSGEGQICEANFYSGELSLLKGSKDEAIRLFRLTVSDCPHGFIEWDAANEELKALGVVP
jgi:hypothetical protein